MPFLLVEVEGVRGERRKGRKATHYQLEHFVVHNKYFLTRNRKLKHIETFVEKENNPIENNLPREGEHEPPEVGSHSEVVSECERQQTISVLPTRICQELLNEGCVKFLLVFMITSYLSIHQLVASHR